MQKFSFHTHTNFSDGSNSIEDMLQQAVNLGWDEIGISDHMIVHENLQSSLSWNKWKQEEHMFWDNFDDAFDYFARSRDYIRKAAENYPIKVRIGAEVDFFAYPGWQEKFEKMIEKLSLDYCISGNHFLFNDDCGSDIFDIDLIHTFEEEAQNKIIKRHLKTLCAAAESGFFDFMAHIDYMRKMDVFAKDIFAEDKANMLKFFADNNITVEVSTKGLRKGGYFYPCADMLKNLVENNVKLVISDDAHSVDQLGYRFDYAEEVLKELNCKNRWSFVEK